MWSDPAVIEELYSEGFDPLREPEKVNQLLPITPESFEFESEEQLRLWHAVVVRILQSCALQLSNPRLGSFLIVNHSWVSQPTLASQEPMSPTNVLEVVQLLFRCCKSLHLAGFGHYVPQILMHICERRGRGAKQAVGDALVSFRREWAPFITEFQPQNRFRLPLTEELFPPNYGQPLKRTYTLRRQVPTKTGIASFECQIPLCEEHKLPMFPFGAPGGRKLRCFWTGTVVPMCKMEADWPENPPVNNS